MKCPSDEMGGHKAKTQGESERLDQNARLEARGELH